MSEMVTDSLDVSPADCGMPEQAAASPYPVFTFPAKTLDLVTDALLARFAELIYRRVGIRVSPQKRMLLSNRLRRRLRKTGIATFEDYYRHLQRLHPDDPEWDAFLQEITTHETYLFRDQSQWDWLSRVYLPECAEAASKGRRPRALRIWSAAASTGDEAFTIACCVAACLAGRELWKVEILGTDVGVDAVNQARRGVFGERAMRLVPETYRQRYFSRLRDEDAWKAEQALTKMVKFRQHNLMHPLKEPPFDLVFLKNVLIYFDAASKKRVVANVRAVTRPGGLLVTGAAEGVGDLLRDCARLQPWLHQQPQ